MNATVLERIAHLIHWQRQVDNARSAAQLASERGDDALAAAFATEALKAERARDEAITAVGIAAGGAP